MALGRFPLPIIIPPAAPHSSSSGAGATGPLVANVPSGLILTASYGLGLLTSKTLQHGVGYRLHSSIQDMTTKGSSCSIFLIPSQNLQSSVFYYVMPCSPLKINQLFRRMCCLHLQCQKISQTRKQHEAGSK